jgi:hypothetical protein
MRSVLLVLAGLVGCSNTFAPQALSGDWAKAAQVPGSFWDMTLAVNGSSITGGGETCGEALACSTFAVNGTVDDNGDVRMDFTYPNSRVEHFAGKVWFDGLRGTVTDNMPSLPPGPVGYAVVFHRANFITLN